MALSNDLISQFVKITNDEPKDKKETIVYGTIQKDTRYVKIDGSDILTPIATTTVVGEGDRVTVMIKNHAAIVTGNLSSPAARSVDTIDVEKLNAQKARIDTLETANLTVQETLKAHNADIEALTADNVTIKNNLTTNNADINTLKASNVTISEKVTANEADIKQLQSDYANIDNLYAKSADIDELEAGIADINTLIFGSATGDVIQTSFSNAVIAQLGDAQIKSAMIESISAGKITTGDIITNNVRVMSEDGKLVISDETLQISDSSRVRVQIGKDAANDYSINIWDQNGNLMFSKGGITDAAIKEAIIRNDMVSDTANIHASKLDIDSLFEEINDSSNTINSTKVYLDEEKQTLDVAFKSLTTEVTEQGETISSQGTAISTIQGQFSSKVWQQDIETAVDDIEIGGRNLLLNSSFSKDYSKWSANSGHDEITEKNGRKCGHINQDTLNQNKYLYQSILNRLEPNTTYKISGWVLTENIVRGTTNPSCMLYTDGYYINDESECIWFSIGSIDISMNSGTGEWVKITGTFKTDDVKFNSATSLNFFVHTRDITGDIYFSELKLEKGNKVTDWTPAPEDTEEDITSLSTQYSEIAQTVSSISTTVAGHTTEISNKADTSTVTTINNKVTTLEQNLDGFQTIVSETYATIESVDDIEPGGRNLLLNSDVVKTTSAYSMIHYTPSSPLVAGEKYTLSLCVTPAEGISYYEAYVSGGYTVIAKLYPTGTDKQIITHTFTAKYSSGRTPDDNVSHADIYLYRFPNDGTVTGASTIHWAKVEKGTKATDWTAAPEDIASQIIANRTLIEQTATDLTVKIESAAKTATNYLKFSTSGLVIGDMTTSTLGKNVLIDSDSVDIRNGEITLASFGADYLYLAKNSRNAKINLCNGLATMYHESKYSYDTIFIIDTGNTTEIMGLINPLCVTSVDDLDQVSIQFANANGVMGGIGIVGNYLRRFGSNMFDNYTILDKGNFDDVMDSGWISGGSLGENFTIYSNDDQIQYRKIGKVVQIRGTVRPTTIITGSSDNHTIFTLPEDYCPSKIVNVRCQGSGAYSWLLSITTGGLVRFSRYNNGSNYIDTSTSSWLPFNVTFFID